MYVFVFFFISVQIHKCFQTRDSKLITIRQLLPRMRLNFMHTTVADPGFWDTSITLFCKIIAENCMEM